MHNQDTGTYSRLKEWLPLSIAIFLYLLSRIFLIFYSSHMYQDEELKQASLGIAFLHGGLKIPFWCYLDSPHAGGSILAGITLIPFFLIFGQRFLALKISALAYSLATFIFIIFCLRKYYDWKRIFFPLLALFILSTPHYLQKSISLFGNAAEFICIGILFIWLIDSILIRGKEFKHSYLLLGIVSGLGLWVQYLFSIFILAFIVFWFFQKGLGILKDKFWHFIAGFGLGFSPWLIYNALYGFPSIYADPRVTGTSFGLFVSPIFFAKKFFNLISTDIPRSLHFLSFYHVSPKVFAYFLCILFLCSFVYIIFLRSENIEKKKFHLFWITLFIISLFSFVFFPLPIGKPSNIWGTPDYESEYYILFFQPIMFVIMIMAYAEEKKNKFMFFLRWGFYLLLPVMLLQYCLISNYPNINKSYSRGLSGTDGESNSFESGYNFSVFPPLWKKVLDKLEGQNYRYAYLKGSARFWGHRIQWPIVPIPGKLAAEISCLSTEREKEFFLKYLEEFCSQRK